jgi:hypothetical protein
MASRVIIPTFEAELRELQALRPPPRDGQQLEAVHAAIRKMIAQLSLRSPVRRDRR